MKINSTNSARPLNSFFLLTFLLSWALAFLLVAPDIFGGHPVTYADGMLMFPVMLIGPVVAGFYFTFRYKGSEGIRDLRFRMLDWSMSMKGHAVVLLVPPVLVFLTLYIMHKYVSPVFEINFFPLGFIFAIPSGFFEEVGWTGYAFPGLLSKYDKVRAGFLLGILWGLWHLPVINFLGAAYPHGQYLIPFILSFIAILVAMRLLMVWLYSKTESLPMMQLMHILSTASLVVMGPTGVTPAQETLWYSAYAGLLWIVVLIVYSTAGKKQLTV